LEAIFDSKGLIRGKVKRVMDVSDSFTQPEDMGDILWDGPPPLPNPDTVVSDISCQGTIAIALREALREMQEEGFAAVHASNTSLGDASEHGESRQSEQSPAATVAALQLSQQAVDRIMLSFGEAITQSQREQRTLQANKQNPPEDNYSSTETAANQESRQAPAALLRGRIDHYNRHGSKWRFLVNDVEIVPRSALDRNRRKRERPSLWDPSQQQQLEPSIKIKRLEILAYDDIE
jgi:hypothetical protein